MDGDESVSLVESEESFANSRLDMETGLIHECWWYTDTRHQCESQYEGHLFLSMNTISGDIEREILELDTFSILLRDKAIDEVKSL